MGGDEKGVRKGTPRASLRADTVRSLPAEHILFYTCYTVTKFSVPAAVTNTENSTNARVVFWNLYPYLVRGAFAGVFI